MLGKKKEHKGLYDLPYNVRVRQKYILFGVLIGVTFMVFCSMGSTTGSILRIMYPVTNTHTYTLIDYQIMLVLQIILFGVCIFASYTMWYSKSKPRGKPELESIGLKYDYDQVKESSNNNGISEY